MITMIKNFIRNFLFDESAAQRYMAAGTYMLGEFLQSGGVIPGTQTVVPIGNWTSFGPPLKALAFYFGSGGTLPKLNGGKVNAK